MPFTFVTNLATIWGSQIGQLCYSMNRDENNNDNLTVLKQLRLALGVSQDGFSKLINCSIRKIQRGEQGKEPGWTLAEMQNLDHLLKERFNARISDLPDSVTSTEPISFLIEGLD